MADIAEKGNSCELHVAASIVGKVLGSTGRFAIAVCEYLRTTMRYPNNTASDGEGTLALLVERKRAW